MSAPNGKGIVGWIGLGAMGLGMATALASQGYTVQAYDVYPPSVEKAVKGGCVQAKSPLDAIAGTNVLGLMVVNVAQVSELLFGSEGVVNALPNGSSVIVFSTCPPSALAAIQVRLDALGTNIRIVDSPVSGGSTRAAQGTLAIMVAGSAAAVETARPVIEALTRQPEGQLLVVGDKVGLASDFKLINQVYCAIQICVTGESMAFAKSLGLHPRLVYDVIRTASGNSFMFGHRVPWQWKDDGIPKSAMTIIAKDVGIVMDEARLNDFPLPLCAQAEQIFTAALGAGLAREDDGNVVKLYQRFGVPSVQEEGDEESEILKAKELSVKAGASPTKVLLVGLGATGLPMAETLKKSGINVVGYDSESSASQPEGPSGADVVVVNVGSAFDARSALVGQDGKSGVLSAVANGATIILSTTVSPSDAVALSELVNAQGRGIKLVDAPVSGGPSRAAQGDLAVMASGDLDALQKAYTTLDALSRTGGNSKNLHFIPGGVGAGSKVNLVNQLLEGVHLAAAAEATAFATRKGMNLHSVFDIVSKGAASSFAMIDRMPRMLKADPPTNSPVNALKHDLNVVLNEAKKVYCPVFLATAAHQQFVRAAASGWSDLDDSSLSRLWESLGVQVASTA